MNEFYKDGLHFACQRCSFCCGHSPGFVYLSRRDLMMLCNFYKLSEIDFAKKNCRWADYYYGEQVLALKEKDNYDCWLWNKGCSAYEARPIQCSTWPFWSWMIKDKETWEECAKECPGMNKGPVISYEEIQKQKNMYDENKPLTKEQFGQLFGSVPELDEE